MTKETTSKTNHEIKPNIATNDMIPVTAENLKKLIKQHGLTQKSLSAITGFTESTISDYRNGKKFPTIDFLFSLKTNFNISIDDFITKNISPADLPANIVSSKVEQDERAAYQKFCGIYFVYYFDTSKYKWRDYSTRDESLFFGVLHIYENPSPLNNLDYSCNAVLGIKDREQATRLKGHLESLKSSAQIEAYINENHPFNAYYGKLELTQNHAFISMSDENKDKLLAIFYRMPSHKPNYSGGIGTINSVSKGRESMPVVQFIGLSRNKLTLSSEEIHHNLLLSYPSYKANDEVDELIRLFKTLYLSPGECNESLSEIQKMITLKSNLERYIKIILENNIFRYGKISNKDDDDWYHVLKKKVQLNDPDNMEMN